MIFLSCPKVNVLTKIIVDCVCLVLLAVYVLVGQTYAFNGLDIAIIVVNSLYTLAYARQLLCKWVPGMPNYLTKAGLINYNYLNSHATKKSWSCRTKGIDFAILSRDRAMPEW